MSKPYSSAGECRYSRGVRLQAITRAGDTTNVFWKGNTDMLSFSKPITAACFTAACFLLSMLVAAAGAQQPRSLRDGWRMQDALKVKATGDLLSQTSFDDSGWYRAVIPGTALTSFVDNGVYPDPAFGENDRPESIPESLNKTSYWYRTTVLIPPEDAGRHTWLEFEGINFAAELWVNGKNLGEMRGAFRRFSFDVTLAVQPGKRTALAVQVFPQPHPGVPHEHTLAAGVGKNGGVTALDGPTFLSTIGWDWIPAMRDRDAGIYQPVSLSSTGDVVLHNPLVRSVVTMSGSISVGLSVTTTLENLSNGERTALIHGDITAPDHAAVPIRFERRVTLSPHESREVRFVEADFPALHVSNPQLWFPNGYGAHPLYVLHLNASFKANRISDAAQTSFGIRKIEYNRRGSDNLAISVNGVPVFIRGGNWGLDEEMKRMPHARLESIMRLHALANLNLIRNWVGQSTSEDFYNLADRYGMLVWDEFFQPNPGDGPNPDDPGTYLANVRDKVLRFRNHPSIILWCARNEGMPPAEIDHALKLMLADLDPDRLYQPSSTEGHGVMSHGPYRWRTPESFYSFPDTEAFKTEIGSVSVPTLESIHGMMPQKDWETINDDWAEHDFARGNSGAEDYPAVLSDRYGTVLNLADFVRKAQMMNYEAFRAMYEGRAARLNAPATAIITWMSNPAQPSFVWQIYHYDLEPMSSYFAVQSAAENLHVQWNEADDGLEVINTRAVSFAGTVKASEYDVYGKELSTQSLPVHALPNSVTRLLKLQPSLSGIAFFRLELLDSTGNLASRNVYWRNSGQSRGDLTAMDAMPPVELIANVLPRTPARGHSSLFVHLENPSKNIAVMSHVQLRNARSRLRVLPAFVSKNYVTLMPHETATIEVRYDSRLLGKDAPLITVDGWNVTVREATSFGVAIRTNEDASPAHWPVTNLPYANHQLSSPASVVNQ